MPTSLDIAKYLCIFSFSFLVVMELYYRMRKKSYKKVNANGFEYIDFGLPSGTLWATKNVGATDSSCNGYYFEFGNIKPFDIRQHILWEKSIFNLGSFERNDSLLINKHDLIFDKNDNLRKGFDIANAHMGGDWVMPTEEDIRELIYNISPCCSYCGYKFIKKTKNGNITMEIPSGLNNSMIMSSTIGKNFMPIILSCQGWWLHMSNVQRNVLCNVRGVIHKQIQPSLFERLIFKIKTFWINIRRKYNI